MELDVIVIGGGPAGSAVSTLLVKAGFSVALFEKEKFPRPHVGESLVPASNRVLSEMGVFEKINSAGFPKKFGAAWTTHSSDEVFEHDFKELIKEDVDIQFCERQQDGVDLPYTFHVDRGKFDKILLDHAFESGVQVHEEAEVFSIEFMGLQNGVAVSVRKDGQEEKHQAKILVDASGRWTFLGNKLDIKIKDPKFNQVAFHSWFSGFDRSDLKFPDNIYIHFIPVSNTWVWQIPISEDITSIGVVTQKQNFPKSREEQEKFFWQCIQVRPKIYSKLKSSERIRDFKVEADYSYGMKELCGDNFVLIGDAARFVDPIFSSGVSVALTSASLAAKDIVNSLNSGNYAKDSFKEYASTLKKGINNWYRFISMYYRLNVLFTYFVHHPNFRLDVLKLLQGDVYDDSHDGLMIEMEKMVSQIEKNPKHPLHQYLGDLTSKSFFI